MSTDELVTQVVAATSIIVALSYLLRSVARRLGQPEVIGQIFAGIALGPSLLGHLPGDPTETLFPTQVLPYISVLAQVALVPFMFAVSCELDLRVLRQRRRLVPAVTAGAFVIPMLLGVGTAFLIGPLYTPPEGPAHDNVSFVMFMAVAMAVTAVPVLAGIIRERGAAGSLPGVVAMTSAGIIDALGWLFLAAAILMSSSTDGDHLPLPMTVALFAGYLVTMWCVVRPLLGRWLSRAGARARDDLPVVAALAMASAWATAALELHVIFGAFVAGLIMPRNDAGEPEPDLVRPLQETGTVLLPVFFVVSGLSVDIGALTADDYALLAILGTVAIAGKLGGGVLGARVGGMSYREATIVGVMLNTRGLTELIALNMGLQSGIIDESLYTVLVLVALVTTVLTGPALTLLRFPEPRATPKGAQADEAVLPRQSEDESVPRNPAGELPGA
ncbi:cation:proton antiporter [Yinghuangia sp. YIM S10712]|uniref:cation:proton antiporter n=1 Tax=Yinghuangia sp. YIM S10712 TaxID=3436930 RepID=UPI003F52937E